VTGVDEEYVEKVLSLVEQVPAGRVTTYGALAAAVGSGGPRQVGTVMSTYGGPVPWWRVVHADGTPAQVHDSEALDNLRAEAAPLRPSGRVDMAQAMWWPQDADSSAPDLSVAPGGMSR
jgi:alkylated DNA nucleotide flippase Atl1